MDSKLKTQNFRFTNHFKIEGEDESIEMANINQQLWDELNKPDSDEDSIEEEIEASFGHGNKKKRIV